ncbi:D-3-phosphoglycerate dehydrogenase [Aphelenchoides fujianensis]|nr:D-3-phosphoglycerate dehydrogenase [Aphelenchoides fujianensis]
MASEARRHPPASAAPIRDYVVPLAAMPADSPNAMEHGGNESDEMLNEKFDLAAFLRNAAASMASSTPPPTAPTTTNATPNAQSVAAAIAASGLSAADTAAANALAGLAAPQPQSSQFPPFQPMRPIYAPSGYGRQILIYDSRSHPGHRREFAYKTRFTNQAGLTTVYYRCMACRALRHRLQRCLPKENLPAVPCIAVKNELLINDPDFPEASDHFCTPLSIEESNHRLKVTFERGFKRARMKLAAEESLRKPDGSPDSNEAANSTVGTPLDMEHWAQLARNFNSVIKEDPIILDETFHSTTSSNEKDAASDASSSHVVQGGSSTSAHSATPTTSPNRVLDDSDLMDVDGPRGRLDALLRLEEQRSLQADRDKSHSPDENLNISNFAQKLFEPSTANDLAALLGLSSSLFNGSTGASTPTATATATITTGSELAKALTKCNGKPVASTQQAAFPSFDGLQMNEMMESYVKNNWQLPEDATSARSCAELTCSLILALARNIPQASAVMKQPKMQKRDFVGDDLFGKTLAIIGIGRVGVEIATRMQAFGMKTIGFDPILTQAEAEKHKIKWCNLEEIWPQADYITLHVPLLPQTTGFINRFTLSKCKAGVRLVNTARGGLINEAELLDALNNGRCAGAALDALNEDQRASNKALLQHARVICTPQLNVATMESQQRAALETAESLANGGSSSGGLFGALNASALAIVLDETKVQYVKAATNLGQILASISAHPKAIQLKHPAGANGLQKALVAGTIVGVMSARGKGYTDVSLMNAEARAKQEGMTIDVSLNKTNELTLSAGSSVVTGIASAAGTLLTSINGQKVPLPVLATGTIGLSLTSNGKSFIPSDKIRTKPFAEYDLEGGSGRLAQFNDLSDREMAELSKTCTVVKFA